MNMGKKPRELICRQQHGLVPRHRCHGRKHVHRLCTGAPGQHVQAECRDLSTEQRGGNFPVGEGIVLPEQHLARLDLSDLLGGQGVDFYHDICFGKHSSFGHDLRTLGGVVCIPITGPFASPCFEQDFRDSEF